MGKSSLPLVRMELRLVGAERSDTGDHVSCDSLSV
jgi:hypothetical protein